MLLFCESRDLRAFAQGLTAHTTTPAPCGTGVVCFLFRSRPEPTGPDGAIYLLTDAPDGRLLKLIP